MNRNQIEAFVARWLRAVQTGNTPEFEHLVPERVLDLNSSSETPRSAFQDRARAVYAAFDELEGCVDELLIDGDRLAWRWTLSGVQRAPFLGELSLGQRITLTGTNFQHLKGGLVVAHFTLLDALGALRQMRA